MNDERTGKKHIDLGILAHVDAGKTTLTERCFLKAEYYVGPDVLTVVTVFWIRKRRSGSAASPS